MNAHIEDMSLEELEIYEAQHQRRVGFWTKLGGGALTFAILFHVIVLILGAIWIFQSSPAKKIVDFGGDGGGGGPRGAQTKIADKKRAAITPVTNLKRILVNGAKSSFAVPDPGDAFGQMAQLSELTAGGATGGLGGAGVGPGFGNGGPGHGLHGGRGSRNPFGLIPVDMSKRCSAQDRSQRLRENGGTPACEEAVVKGLNWLKAHQSADGSWGDQNKSAMTGLALLAYFGHCETPKSIEFGDSCLRAITYLVDIGMKNGGKLCPTANSQQGCYENAIATYAIAEAYTFCKELDFPVPNLAEVTAMAGQFIIDNQHKTGGWAYAYATYDGHVDVSVAGWQIQALRACSHTGIKFRGLPNCMSRAFKYLEGCQNDIGAFGYTGAPAPGQYSALTGVGVLCLQMWGKGGKPVSKGVKAISTHTRFEYGGDSGSLYQHYYESQAMMQQGGSHWKKYNNMFRDQILNNQNPDGSWKKPGGKGPGASGQPVYDTSLCILMLEVYYRFLSTGGGGGLRNHLEI